MKKVPVMDDEGLGGLGNLPSDERDEDKERRKPEGQKKNDSQQSERLRTPTTQADNELKETGGGIRDVF